MKLILSSPLEEKTTKRKSSFLGFTQEMQKKSFKLSSCKRQIHSSYMFTTNCCRPCHRQQNTLDFIII